MKKNMGKADRIIRILIAAILSVLFVTNIISGTLGIVLLVISAVLLLTSFISLCPIYAPFGIKTCSTEKK